MRRIALSFLVGTAMTVGGLSVVAQPVATPAKSDSGEGRPDNQTYMQAARERIRVWERKINDYDKQPDGAGANLKTELDAAWTRTKAEEGKLETATADDWKRVKAAFDHASSDLEDALQRARVRLD